MKRRSVVLEEMGIAPLWRLRTPGASAPSAAHASEGDLHAYGATASEAANAGAAAEISDAAPAVHPTLPPSEPDARRSRILNMDWSVLKEAVAGCVACPLHQRRTRTVFGVGDEHAQWLFVGEGPGAEEDAIGEPFVGQAGRLLDSMLAALDLQRGRDVYIANVVKCRPPNNRNPESGEMSCCEPYLARQIELIAPKVIVALGKTAANHLLETDATIASLRGRVHAYRGTPLIVTYHPAYLLRTLPDKAKAWVDLCFARETLSLQGRAASTP